MSTSYNVDGERYQMAYKNTTYTLESYSSWKNNIHKFWIHMHKQDDTQVFWKVNFEIKFFFGKPYTLFDAKCLEWHYTSHATTLVIRRLSFIASSSSYKPWTKILQQCDSVLWAFACRFTRLPTFPYSWAFPYSWVLGTTATLWFSVASETLQGYHPPTPLAQAPSQTLSNPPSLQICNLPTSTWWQSRLQICKGLGWWPFPQHRSCPCRCLAFLRGKCDSWIRSSPRIDTACSQQSVCIYHLVRSLPTSFVFLSFGCLDCPIGTAPIGCRGSLGWWIDPDECGWHPWRLYESIEVVSRRALFLVDLVLQTCGSQLNTMEEAEKKIGECLCCVVISLALIIPLTQVQ